MTFHPSPQWAETLHGDERRTVVALFGNATGQGATVSQKGQFTNSALLKKRREGEEAVEEEDVEVVTESFWLCRTWWW